MMSFRIGDLVISIRHGNKKGMITNYIGNNYRYYDVLFYDGTTDRLPACFLKKIDN